MADRSSARPPVVEDGCPQHINTCQRQDAKAEVEITTATVDRLLHHAHVVVTAGDSHRLSEAVNGNGVVALS